MDLLGGSNSMSTFKTKDGTKLFLNIQQDDHPVWLIHTHGIGEHSGRHQYIMDLFADKFNVFLYDLRSHGKSEGKKASVHDFDLFMEDLHELIMYLKKEHGMKRFVLSGHSMGALITCAYVQRFSDPKFYPELVFVNAPPVNVGGPAEKLAEVMPFHLLNKLANIKRSIALPGLVDSNILSHDPEVAPNYKSDPLNATALHTNLLLGLVKSSRETFSRPIGPNCPAYITIGSEDRVVSYPRNLHYFKSIEKSFDLKVFEGAYHEIHNEIEEFRTPYFEHLKSTICSIL
jgi:alpha-beta hydrolase superfamily lysophospholipase